MRALVTTMIAIFALSVLSPDADARRKRRKRRAKKALKATKKTRLGVNKLMGPYKWGMTSDKILGMLETRLRKRLEPKVRATRDPLEQDRKRREMRAAIKKVKKNHVKFTGKRTPWDVSLVDKEFAHKNHEAMVVNWGQRERRFFFFHHNRLWKIFIAFNADLFRGKTFEDFAQAMEARFGPAERKYTTTLSGEAKMDHLAWPAAGNTKLIAYDYTGFYGNFSLVLLDTKEFENVKTGRKLNSPKKDYSDPLVDAVTKGGESTGDTNEDIVDRITGKGSRAPSVTDSAPPAPQPSRPGTRRPTYEAPEKKKPRKKVDPSNPLDGLDI